MWYFVCTLLHTCVRACVWAVQIQRSFWRQCVHAHPPCYVHGLSLILSISLALEAQPMLRHPNMLPRSASGHPQNGDDPPVVMLGISLPGWPAMERKASDY